MYYCVVCTCMIFQCDVDVTIFLDHFVDGSEGLVRLFSLADIHSDCIQQGAARLCVFHWHNNIVYF